MGAIRLSQKQREDILQRMTEMHLNREDLTRVLIGLARKKKCNDPPTYPVVVYKTLDRGAPLNRVPAQLLYRALGKSLDFLNIEEENKSRARKSVRGCFGPALRKIEFCGREGKYRIASIYADGERVIAHIYDSRGSRDVNLADILDDLSSE